MGEVYGEFCVSASPIHLDVFFFPLDVVPPPFAQYVVIAQLVFIFILVNLRGNYSICSLDSVCLWGKVSSSSCCHLNPNLCSSLPEVRNVS